MIFIRDFLKRKLLSAVTQVRQYRKMACRDAKIRRRIPELACCDLVPDRNLDAISSANSTGCTAVTIFVRFCAVGKREIREFLRKR
jgi:hypothetical protein